MSGSEGGNHLGLVVDQFEKAVSKAEILINGYWLLRRWDAPRLSPGQKCLSSGCREESFGSGRKVERRRC